MGCLVGVWGWEGYNGIHGLWFVVCYCGVGVVTPGLWIVIRHCEARPWQSAVVLSLRRRYDCGNLLRYYLILVYCFLLFVCCALFFTLGSRVREKDTWGVTLSPHCSHNIAKSYFLFHVNSQIYVTSSDCDLRSNSIEMLE